MGDGGGCPGVRARFHFLLVNPDGSLPYTLQPLTVKKKVAARVRMKEKESAAAVNLSFSFRTPATS